jgi:hypothetical protein|tara:strand:- start:2036 stop:2917 length:882 start_codon:yes stop_codon:yes gene_type:complete
MTTKTWYDLADHFCTREKSLLDGGDNQYFERLAARRYNYAKKSTPGAVRLVFLQSAGADSTNKTLLRNGRFVWCKNLRYEGINKDSLRKLSFTIGKGKKRFVVTEEDVLVIPGNIFINNNSFFRNYSKVFSSFPSVFNCRECLKIMRRSDEYDWGSLDEFAEYIASYTPFRPGTLVQPRLGLFIPKIDKLEEKMSELSGLYCDASALNSKRGDLISYLSGRDYITTDKALLDLFHGFRDWCEEEPLAKHPVGIVLGRSRNISPHSGKELYRVSFAETIYEQVHPIQLEVLNEV